MVPVKFAWLPLLLLAVGTACKSLPEARPGVAAIRFRGNSELGNSDLSDRIATQETPKFLGLFRASWRRYEEFEPEVLEKDLERIEHYYQRRGFYETKVRAGRVVPRGKFVDVEILIQEGKPVHVRSVVITGMESKAALALRVKEGVLLDPGDVFNQEKFEASTKAMSASLATYGFAYAEVKPHAIVDLGPRAADLSFQVDTGVECKVGEVTFEGVGDDLPEAVIRRTFGVKSGDPYDMQELEAGRRHLINLGVFASADVEPDLSSRNRTDVPIKVTVTRSSLRGFRLGGGLQADFTRSDIHALVGWEHRNLFGGMRHFTVEERPALVFFPTALSQLDLPQRVFPANSLGVTLSQPAFPEARTTSTLHGEFNNYPIILSPVNPSQVVFPGYHEVRGMIGPERYYSSLNLRAAVLYNIQANFPFAYVGELNPAFDRVIASYIDLKAQFDVRDDPIQAKQGFLLQNSLQFAGGILGGDARDVRIQPQMRMYVPISSNVTLAGKTVLGLLWPFNYGSTLGTDFLAIPDDAGARPFIRDLQLTYFRGFFSGGADSNRGYGYRDIGPHGVNPLVIPGSLAEEKARCDPAGPQYDPRLCLVASGGLSLWEASVELRYPIYGDLGGVLFLDASDVSARKFQIRLEVPHLSSGFGIRYATPVGPLRFDIGFRIPGAQRLGGEPDPLLDGPPPKTFLGLPAAIALGLGEAY